MVETLRPAVLAAGMLLCCACSGGDGNTGLGSPAESDAAAQSPDGSVGDDAGTGSDAPKGQDGQVAADAAPDQGQTATPGTQCAVDRTAPCSEAEYGEFRYAPPDYAYQQACLPNYDIWAPVVCGGPYPACACDASRCLPGEAAKLVSGEFCVCLNLCSTQAKEAVCGGSGERGCIPVDDTTGTQVFICGGTG